MADEVGHGGAAQQPELEVLGPAADGGDHPLRVGRRQHEHDVTWRLLERLEQGVRGGGRQHVDLVHDVDLPATGSAERRPGDEVPHGLDAVVRRRIELVDVEGGAQGDLHARVTCPARQDARRRCLAGAARSAEQVGVGNSAVTRRVAKSPGDMVLALHLAEALGAVATVERLIGLVGHGGPDYRRAASSPPFPITLGRRAPGRRRAVARCGSQADCGTRKVPLRAAAFRP